jgi:hypothetical protein
MRMRKKEILGPAWVHPLALVHQQRMISAVGGMEAYRAETNQYPPLLPITRAPQSGGPVWSPEDLPRLYPELVKKFR